MWSGGFNAARGFVCGAAKMIDVWRENDVVSMPHAALWVVQLHKVDVVGNRAFSFNAARGFVGGATPHGCGDAS